MAIVFSTICAFRFYCVFCFDEYYEYPSRLAIQPAPPAIIAYRAALPIVTSTIKCKKRTRMTPAKSVSGSPIIGSHASKSDQSPYLPNQSEARSRASGDTGNHRRSLK